MDAAYDICANVGYSNVTFSQIAEQSGSTRQTIYRWWPDRRSLFLEIIVERFSTLSDTGPGQDLEVVLRAVYTGLQSPLGAICIGVFSEAQQDPRFLAGTYRAVMKGRQEFMGSVLEATAAKHDSHFDVPLQVVIDMVAGAMWYRMIVGHAPLDEVLAQQLNRAVIQLLVPNHR